MRERALEKYLRAVGRRLPCGRARRKELVAGLREELLDRLPERPVTRQALERALGTPDAAAAQMAEEFTDRDAARWHREKLFRVIAAAVLAALALWAGVVGWVAVVETKNSRGYDTVTVKDGPSFPEEDPYQTALHRPVDGETGG